MAATTTSGPTHSAHYVSGTHWDREWYRPYPEFRVLLVQLMDGLLDLMETSEDFRYFQLDGQTCVLDDYLEIRPENRDRLAKLITEGRILIGPWFTMPDLFCVGDEALLRNLLLGRRICREWGVEPMSVGFICDMFGHPSQMPQIFAGFGLDDIVLGRGVNEHTTPMFFTWEAPDGSRAFTFKLQDRQGYGAFAVPRAIIESPDSVAGGLMLDPEGFKTAIAAAADNPQRRAETVETWVRRELARYIDHETERANGPVIALMDSMDHVPPAADVAGYLRMIGEACPSVAARHSTLPAFFTEARERCEAIPTRRGELREPSRDRCEYLWLIPNCVSARVRLKQANDTCQDLLEKWVEPLAAIAELAPDKTAPDGPAGFRSFLRAAWKPVLLNHAHDSICGCSIDQVHRDMVYRFDQARGLGEQLRSQAIGALTRDCAELGRREHEFTLTIVNPLPTARDEVVVFDVDLPPDYPADFAEAFYTQRIKAFTLEDADGQPVPYQRLAFRPHVEERSRFARFAFVSDGEFVRYTVAAKVALPALGFTSLRVAPSPRPVRAVGSLRTGPTSAENERLAIAMATNGTLTVTDKGSGEIYTDLLTFEDRGEEGDGWFHSHSINDEQVLSSASSAQVAVVHDGPELVAFRSTILLRVPARYDAGTESPSDETVDLRISSVVALRRGAQVVDVETTVDNCAEDHRLRVLLPSDATEATTYVAHQPYDFVERPIALDPQTADWQETEQAEKPFLGLQAVGAEARGLAFLSAGGLHEGGVADDARRTMHVTLLRSFRRTVGTSGETDGLEPGRLVYRYALMPFAGALDRAAALRELARLQAGVTTRQSGQRPSGFPPLGGAAAAERSFIALAHGRLAVSAIKPPEDGDGMIVRLWNPTGHAQKDALRFWRKIASAQAVTLGEEADPEAPQPTVRGNTVTVEAPPHRIVTLRLAFA